MGCPTAKMWKDLHRKKATQWERTPLTLNTQASRKRESVYFGITDAKSNSGLAQLGFPILFFRNPTTAEVRT